MTTLCTNCYAQIAPGSTTCPSCGHTIDQTTLADQGMAPPDPQRFTYAPPPGYQQQAYQGTARTSEQSKLLAAGILMLIYGLFGLLFSMIFINDVVNYSDFLYAGEELIMTILAVLLLVAAILGFIGAAMAIRHRGFKIAIVAAGFQTGVGAFFVMWIPFIGEFMLLAFGVIALVLMMMSRNGFDDVVAEPVVQQWAGTQYGQQ